MNAYFTLKHQTNNNWRMPRAHFHDTYEILLCLSEECNFFINNNTYNLKWGSLVFISEGTLHHSFVEENTCYERYALHFPSTTLTALSSSQTNLEAVFKGLNCCVALNEEQAKHVIWLYKCCQKYEGSNFGDDIRCNIFFLETLLNFCQLLQTCEHIPQATSAAFDKIAPIIGFIDEHLAESLSLDRLAGQFFINKYYLCHLFKEVTGFTVVEYINSRRVLHARNLLKQGWSVRNSGRDSGFSNSAHFIRIFSKLNGLTPGQYAKTYKNKHGPAP